MDNNVDSGAKNVKAEAGIDARLSEIIAVWDSLTEGVKEVIMKIVKD